MSHANNTRIALADWAMSQPWDIFGTLNFAFRRKPSQQEARRAFSRFWNEIDRRCYGQSHNGRLGIPRFAWIHSGADGDNFHMHFLAQTPFDVKETCILLNSIWTESSERAAVPSQNEILPVRSLEGAAWYPQHEDSGFELHSFDPDFTHLPAQPRNPKSEALAKLRDLASRNINKATIAFEIQRVEAEQRDNKRIGK